MEGRDPWARMATADVERLKAGLARARKEFDDFVRYNGRTRIEDLEIDTLRRIVRRGTQRIDLKPKEYSLLEFLMHHVDRPVTRSLIIEHVWDIHFDSVSNVVEVHINALRNKIDRGFDRPLIHTIRGVGYILTDSPAS